MFVLATCGLRLHTTFSAFWTFFRIIGSFGSSRPSVFLLRRDLFWQTVCWIWRWVKNWYNPYLVRCSLSARNMDIEEWQRIVVPSKMWRWRRLGKNWVDTQGITQDALKRTDEERSILITILRRKTNWIGHMLRRLSICETRFYFCWLELDEISRKQSVKKNRSCINNILNHFFVLYRKAVLAFT